MLFRSLIVGALVWPVMLGAALWDRATHPAEDRGVFSAVVYAAASVVCHQQDVRSFHSSEEKWPVCARCSGLYLAAPLGVGWFLLRRRRGPVRVRLDRALALAAVPTVLTVAWEWAGQGMPPNPVRFLTAIPLGAAVAWVLLAVAHRVD